VIYWHKKDQRGEYAMEEHLEVLGPYRYRWDGGCFPLSADSLALGDFCTLRPGDRVMDLGCGAGLLLLLCARRQEGLALTGVELDPHAAGLARDNLAAGGLAGTVLTGDLRELAPGLSADLVVSNPPWYPTGQRGDGARVEGCTLRELCAAGAKALGHRGRFALVHRPERLVELLLALRQAGVEPKRLAFCRHSPDKPPYAVLVEGVKGGRPGLAVEPDRL